MTTNSIPMFKSTLLLDVDENEEIARIDGVCPLPVGSVVRAPRKGSPVEEYRVVETHLHVGKDATLIVHCRASA